MNVRKVFALGATMLLLGLILAVLTSGCVPVTEGNNVPSDTGGMSLQGTYSIREVTLSNGTICAVLLSDNGASIDCLW